jgi:hypothetical protein
MMRSEEISKGKGSGSSVCLSCTLRDGRPCRYSPSGAQGCL